MEDKTYGTLVTDCGIQLIAAAVMEGKKINITDLAVQWFLSKKMYDVIELNIFLAKRGEEPLN